MDVIRMLILCNSHAHCNLLSRKLASALVANGLPDVKYNQVFSTVRVFDHYFMFRPHNDRPMIGFKKDCIKYDLYIEQLINQLEQQHYTNLEDLIKDVEEKYGY